MAVDTILLIAALVCFVIAALGISIRQFSLIAAGLALVTLAQLI